MGETVENKQQNLLLCASAKRGKRHHHFPGFSGTCVSPNRIKGLHFEFPNTLLEAEIKRNRGRPLLIGRDLQTIRDRRLYADTWDKYCKGRFNFSGRSGNFYISAWRTAQYCGVPEHISPRALRPLTGLAPERQREAWGAAVGLTKNGVPSATMIAIAASKFTRPQMAPWSLRAARQIVSLGFKRTLEKAYAWASEEQKAQLASELEDLLNHARELTA